MKLYRAPFCEFTAEWIEVSIIFEFLIIKVNIAFHPFE